MSQELPRIHLLSPSVANQIAAGEVVERPASVVKELVENSLDAGARRVVIHLQDGGRQLIRVTDDGFGMSASDARLAFARHATSKLVSADDLVDLHSYGFRGEALASILSVARVTLTTRRTTDAVGVRLTGAGGVNLQESPAGCAVGTTIEVADLFFNVPARLKFLRTAPTELGQVVKFVEALALARPALHLTLRHGDRTVLELPPEPDLTRRVHAVWGADIAERLYPIEEDREYQVRGLLSEPGLNHAGPGQLCLLVGGRPVADRTLAQAAAQAYGALLERGRYPVGILSVTCPPGTVDVNVHPAKTEVRFASSSAVFSAVMRAVRPMLAETPWVKRELAEAVASRPRTAALGPRTPDSIQVAPGPSLQALGTTVGSFSVPQTSSIPEPGTALGVGVHAPHPAPLAVERAAETPGPAADVLGQAVPRDPSPAVGAAATAALGWAQALQPLPLERAVAGAWSALRYVGQVGRCFLICEGDGAMVMIDQHAAHERVLFERFVVSFRQGGFASQALLVPLAVPLAPAEVAALEEEGELLRRLGFEVEAAGQRLVRVRAYPAVLRDSQIAEEVRTIAASLVSGGRGRATEQRLERFAATLACHGAFRAGDVLEVRDVNRLLAEMDGVDLAAYCPHGRPVWTRLRMEEIGKWFHRT